MADIGGMRAAYHGNNEIFDVSDLVSREPFKQFDDWFELAKSIKTIEEPNAMHLATATNDGKPSARLVLLKKYGKDDGFIFYSNYNSRKGKEINSNPFAALTFYWEPLKMSVRIEGSVERIGAEESREYFQSRPKESQIGAAVSHQSEVIPSRAVLTEREASLKAEFAEKSFIPKPDEWGGFRVIPNSFEFWKGQSNRIHDRIRFRKPQPDEKIDETLAQRGEDGWIIERLSP